MGAARILIVEDQFLIATRLRKELQVWGYEVIGYETSGTAAIERAVMDLPDLILMDIVLEGPLDGTETARRLKQLPETRGIPIVFVTGHSDDETLERALEVSASGYVVKPYKAQELRALVETTLQKQRQQVAVENALVRAEARSEVQARYLNLLSRECREPLTAILTATQMLQHHGDLLTGERRQRHFERIESAIYQINQTLDDVLDLNRGRRIDCTPVALDLVAFCRHLTDEVQARQLLEMQPPPPRKPCTIRMVYGRADTIVFLDVTLLRQILTNLLSNAIKYCPGGGEIVLEVKGDLDTVVLSVADRGIGIPADYLPRLYRPFQRAKNVGQIVGTGLGLSIVKQAVDRHGGTIEIDSVMDGGTTCVVTLPSLPDGAGAGGGGNDRAIAADREPTRMASGMGFSGLGRG